MAVSILRRTQRGRRFFDLTGHLRRGGGIASGRSDPGCGPPSA
jgi:hypothetical protein